MKLRFDIYVERRLSGILRVRLGQLHRARYMHPLEIRVLQRSEAETGPLSVSVRMFQRPRPETAGVGSSRYLLRLVKLGRASMRLYETIAIMQ